MKEFDKIIYNLWYVGLGGFYSLIFFHCTILFLQFDVPCINDRDVQKRIPLQGTISRLKAVELQIKS